MLTACFIYITVHLASNIDPTPTRFSWNPGITCPLVGKYEGSLSIDRSHELADVIGCSEVVLTWIRGAVGSTLFLGASLVKK